MTPIEPTLQQLAAELKQAVADERAALTGAVVALVEAADRTEERVKHIEATLDALFWHNQVSIEELGMNAYRIWNRIPKKPAAPPPRDGA